MNLLRKKLIVKNIFPGVEVIEPLTSRTSSWLNSIPFFRDFERTYSNKRDALNNFSKWKSPGGEAPTTIRFCPGIKNLFNNSVLVRWPCDFLIHNDNGILSWNSPDGGLLKVSHHLGYQYKADNFNFTNFKITVPCAITSNKPLDIIPLQPFYHSQENLDVVIPPGVVTTSSNVDFMLTINFMLSNTAKSYTFNKGDPMVYLYANEPFKLVSNNDPIRPYQRTKFFNDVKGKLDD